MPLADFSNARNWGYDGVLAFAPDASAGTPDELKALAASTRADDLIDVVYNRPGRRQYLPRGAAILHRRHPTRKGSSTGRTAGASFATQRAL
jgi:1,4-alpha-glucan branching enzyme